MTVQRQLIVFLLFLLISPWAVLAQTDRGNQMSLTLTPPLFQLGIAAGGPDWKGTLRLVNGNSYPVAISARAVPFTPDGETGNAKFGDIDAPPDPTTLAGWITVPRGTITVGPDSTAEIPITIRVPADASPGGHYAAVLVGTSPGAIGEGKSGVAIGSMLASLIFVRVPGLVDERGEIRDFYALDDILERPEARFVVRFENTGNVHLVPRGEISIRNMWGKERGKIVVNDDASFGNVLPKSTRKFEFLWTGEENAFEFGRYTALVTLAYGENGAKTVFRETAFWIIPWKPVLTTLALVVFSLWFFAFAIRRYVRRALELERQRLGISSAAPLGEAHVVVTARTLREPILRGVQRLSEDSKRSKEGAGVRLHAYVSFVRENALFFSFMSFLLIILTLIGWYFAQVLEEERAYRVEVIRDR